MNIMTKVVVICIYHLINVACSTIISNNNHLPVENIGLVLYSLRSNRTSVTPIQHELIVPNKSPRLPIIGEPCSCIAMNCGCCAGMNIQQINFNQLLCSNFTYHPDDFALQMDVSLNENTLYHNRLSAKNPPPLCIPIPIPIPIPISVELCFKLSDIFTSGRNIHLCLDIQGQIQKQPIVIFHFDCMRMGQDGVALLKPGDNTWIDGNPGVGGMIIDPPQTDSDIFDPVNEIKKKINR